ncbi:hypothetical protein N0B16_09715 [Chryseobacterium sp. GMJ5]|uniref:Uncharacterized protein n=1 Tax=Chryseobacterium gilvum TaxID=2976534 RepID=A0ABT2VXJ3_9FLAO|nr:hypothetical protein [Chryseobacterium gilvum]MCU7614710.1 hypothetical protein [Chryseobacterium gilvum]
MIIFNLGAVIQAFIAAVIGFILYQMGIIDLINNHFQLTTNNKGILACYGVYFIAVVTHKLGAKGRLFFIPVWIICLLLIFITNFANRGNVLNSSYDTALTYINYIAPVILFFITFSWLHISTNSEVVVTENKETINQA